MNREIDSGTITGQCFLLFEIPSALHRSKPSALVPAK